MRRTAKLGAAAATTLLAVAGLTACGSSSGDQAGGAQASSTPSSAPSSSPSSDSSASAAPSAGSSDSSQTATITIKDYKYSGPASVAPGTKITVTNQDSAAHTVTADSKGGFDVTVPPGKSATFTAPSSAGSYAFHCTFHANMHGTLKVG